MSDSDICLRLIRHAHIDDRPGDARLAMLDAAGEIERLREEVERLREALQKIENGRWCWVECEGIARKALEGAP